MHMHNHRAAKIPAASCSARRCDCCGRLGYFEHCLIVWPCHNDPANPAGCKLAIARAMHSKIFTCLLYSALASYIQSAWLVKSLYFFLSYSSRLQGSSFIVTDDKVYCSSGGAPPEVQYLINDDYMTVGTDCTDFKIAKTLGVQSTGRVEQIAMSKVTDSGSPSHLVRPPG